MHFCRFFSLSCIVALGACSATPSLPDTSPDSAATPMSNNTPSSSVAAPSVYDRIGAAPFATLVELHYAGIDGDPRLRDMFPSDLSASSAAVRNLREFLVQYFGGPEDYSARKGHPRLRARHADFTIDQAARDAWLEHALAALDKSATRHNIPPDCREEIREYLVRVSQFMINEE